MFPPHKSNQVMERKKERKKKKPGKGSPKGAVGREGPQTSEVLAYEVFDGVTEYAL
jgi:hypothetical protein